MKVSLNGLLGMIVLICCNPVFGQVASTDASKRFSFLAGANASNMNFNNSPTSSATPVPSTWKAGVSVGVAVRVELFDNFYFQPGYYYMQRNGADKSKETNYTMDYLSLPVLFNYDISSRFSVFAGPQFDLLINAKSEANEVNSTITHDVEERSIALTGGLEIEIIDPFFISLKYMHGFNHIGIGQRSAVKEFKYQGVNVVAGIRF